MRTNQPLVRLSGDGLEIATSGGSRALAFHTTVYSHFYLPLIKSFKIDRDQTFVKMVEGVKSVIELCYQLELWVQNKKENESPRDYRVIVCKKIHRNELKYRDDRDEVVI